MLTLIVQNGLLLSCLLNVPSVKETHWNVHNDIRKIKIDGMAADFQLQWCVLRGMLLMASSSYINYKETNWKIAC